MVVEKRRKAGQEESFWFAHLSLGVVIGTGYFTRSIWRRYLAEFANSLETPYQGSTTDPSIWFELTIKNEVILHSTKVEMGQGIFTGLAQIAAEELGANIDQVQVKHAETISGNIDLLALGVVLQFQAFGYH